MGLDSQKSLILLAKVANLEFWGAIPQGLVDLKLSHCGHYPMKEPLNQLPRCWSDASRWLVPLNNSMALYSCVGITQPITAPNLSQNNPLGLLPQCRLAPPPAISAIGFTNEKLDRGLRRAGPLGSNLHIYALAGRLALHTLWASKDKGKTRNPSTTSRKRLLAQWGLAGVN